MVRLTRLIYFIVVWLTTVTHFTGCRKDQSEPPTPFATPIRDAVKRPLPADKVTVVDRTVWAMKTLFTVGVPSAVEQKQAYEASNAAFDEIRRIEKMMSTFDPNSELSRVNANAEIAPVVVSKELVELVQEAIRISKLTDGKYNIAVEALSDLWKFRDKSPRLPDPAEIAKRLPLSNYKSILIDRDKNTIYLAKRGMRISLASIAKGYAVDRAGQILVEHGINDFIVNGGGDILFSGKKGDKPWNVGVRNPRDKTQVFARFDIIGKRSVSTSGDYEKYFIIDGKRYHHLLDPATGYPAYGAVNVSVIAKNATLSDALATAISVLGVEKGMKLVEADPDLQAIIVDENLQVHISNGLKGRVKLTPIAARINAPSR